MSSEALERVLAALAGQGKTVLARYGSHQAQCPAHDDTMPSLSVRAVDGKVLLNCHAGCDYRDVAAALGLAPSDLFDEQSHHGRPVVIAEYPYVDEHGAVLFIKERRLPKDFRIKRPDGSYGMGGARRVVYRLPEVLAAVHDGRLVYVVEGEKDADALAARGHVATTNFEGAAKPGQRSKWRPEYGDALKGARVVIVADRDEPGRAHAAAVAADLAGKVASVAVVEAAAGKDVSDHLAAGLTVDQLQPVEAESPERDEQPWPEEVPRDDMDARVNSLIAEMLDAEALDGLPALEPLVDDVLFLDTVARLYGPSGVFKSFITLSLAGSVGTGLSWHGKRVRQGPVIYLVAEGARGMGKRKRAWEQHHGRKMTGVKFLPRPVQVKSPEWAVLVEACRRLRPALVILDTQARVTVGVNENDNSEMGLVIERMEELRRACGACVLIVHHAGHENAERGRGASSVTGGLQTELGVSRTGRGIARTRVTLSMSKQKDDEEESSRVFRLRQITLEGEAKEDGGPVTSVVLVPEEAATWGELEEGSPAWIVQRLDAANVPADWGNPRVIKACADLGIKAAKSKIEEAVKIRKNRTNQVPPHLPYPSVTSASQLPGEGDEVSAGQTFPGKVAGRSREASSDLPSPSPPLREGEGREGPHGKDGPLALCEVCLQVMSKITPDQTRHPMCEPNGDRE